MLKLNSHRKEIFKSAKYAGWAILLIALSAGLVYFLFNNRQAQNSSQTESQQVLRGKINGRIINSPDEDKSPVVGIMIENSAESWPQAGLDKADLVFEAITESSIPRFLAIYGADKNIEKIGPVRSARQYFLDWADPYKLLYLHVGGSPEALTSLKSGQYDLVNLDQFFNGQYFWRDKWQDAPHNVYTSSDLISQAIADKNLTATDFESRPYKDDAPPESRPQNINDIQVNFAPDLYRAKWQYNQKDNNYLRYQNNEIHAMADGAKIFAKNIIVQVNDMKVIDSLGRKEITMLGEGAAWIFRDGEAIPGKWKKEGKDKIIRYYDSGNQEIKLNAGSTWVEVIPEEKDLKY